MEDNVKYVIQQALEILEHRMYDIEEANVTIDGYEVIEHIANELGLNSHELEMFEKEAEKIGLV